jgi:hypothetical protein
MNYIGFNASFDINTHTYEHSLGWFMGTDGLSYIYAIDYDNISAGFAETSALYLVDNNNWNNDTHTSNDTYSTLLVKVTDVPEPSTIAMFALTLMGLSTRRFRKG